MQPQRLPLLAPSNQPTRLPTLQENSQQPSAANMLHILKPLLPLMLLQHPAALSLLLLDPHTLQKMMPFTSFWHTSPLQTTLSYLLVLKYRLAPSKPATLQAASMVLLTPKLRLMLLHASLMQHPTLLPPLPINPS